MFPYRTLTTHLAKTSLLIVEIDVVVTLAAPRLVTKFVVVFSMPSPAFLIHGVASKHVLPASWRDTTKVITHIILRTGRIQNEGSVEVSVVVFKLIVVGQANVFFYPWRVFAVAEGRGEVVAAYEDLRVSTVCPCRLIQP